MNFKTFSAFIVILILAGIASAAYATYVHSAFKIGDGKDIDLMGNKIGNGSMLNVNCTNCYGFNSTTTVYTNISSTETNASNISKGVLNTALFLNITYANQFSSVNAALSSITNNQTLFIPGGIFTLVNALDLTNHNNITIEGTGRNSILRCTGNIDLIGGTNVSRATIKQLNLIGCTQNVISLTNSENVIIENNEISNSSLKGIVFTQGRNNEVRNNYIHNNGQEAVVIAIDPAKNYTTDDFRIINNFFVDNGGYNGVGTVTQTGGTYISNVSIIGNVIDASNDLSANNINFGGCYDCQILNNVLRGGTQQSIILGISGSQYQKVNQTVVSGNVIYDVQVGYDAIRVQSGYNNTISGNTIISQTGKTFSENAGDYNVVWFNIRQKNATRSITMTNPNSNASYNFP